MNEFLGSGSPRLAKWPFLTADLVLVGLALACYGQGGHWPFGDAVGLAAWEGWILTVCFSLGAVLGVLPFVLEYRVTTRMDELARVQRGLEQIKNIEQIGRQISSATASWQAVQDDAGKAVATARELNERMNTEAQAFQDFLQRAQDTERTHLRLEVDKLRRSEGEWLQVIVRMLDHVWALYRAAVHSGRVNLVGQLSLFQRACRDAAQRVGVVPFVPSGGDAFDEELHQPAEGSEVVETESKVHEALATGFRYQGQMVRKALVVLQSTEGSASSAGPSDIGQDEFTRQLASDFREAADTEFVQAMADEGLPSAETEHPKSRDSSAAEPAPPEPAPTEPRPFDPMEDGATEFFRSKDEEKDEDRHER
jgi:molecular chaperone GrpE (heat shock protein)